MVKIRGKEIPNNKNISIALTYLQGIGRTSAEQIIKKCNIHPYTKAKELSEAQIEAISHEMKNYVIEEKLREQVQKNIEAKISLGNYQGSRLSRQDFDFKRCRSSQP